MNVVIYYIIIVIYNIIVQNIQKGTFYTKYIYFYNKYVTKYMLK